MNQRWSRYAPSPTGPQHLGNLQTALAAWLQSRLYNTGFILRIEDLDVNRCQPCHTESITEDLRWLGLNWDIGPGAGQLEDYTQTYRYDLYHVALGQLAEKQRLFPCTCSRKELNDIANAPHGPLGQIYPGTCSHRELETGFDWTATGLRAESVRFRCGSDVMAFEDRVAGRLECRLASQVGDFVVFRRDGIVAYHLAVVADDIAMNVGDVLRGEDLLWSVFPQLCLYDALDAPQPRYWHVPLRVGVDGRRLSKRFGSPTLRALTDRGASPEDVIGVLALDLGLVDTGSPISLGELLSGLNPESFDSALQSKSRFRIDSASSVQDS